MRLTSVCDLREGDVIMRRGTPMTVTTIRHHRHVTKVILSDEHATLYCGHTWAFPLISRGGAN